MLPSLPLPPFIPLSSPSFRHVLPLSIKSFLPRPPFIPSDPSPHHMTPLSPPPFIPLTPPPSSLSTLCPLALHHPLSPLLIYPPSPISLALSPSPSSSFRLRFSLSSLQGTSLLPLFPRSLSLPFTLSPSPPNSSPTPPHHSSSPFTLHHLPLLLLLHYPPLSLSSIYPPLSLSFFRLRPPSPFNPLSLSPHSSPTPLPLIHPHLSLSNFSIIPSPLSLLQATSLPLHLSPSLPLHSSPYSFHSPFIPLSLLLSSIYPLSRSLIIPVSPLLHSFPVSLSLPTSLRGDTLREPIGNTSITISSDRDCEEIGSIYGSTIFWTMQAVSILGLVLSFAGLLTCAAGEAGYDVPAAVPVVLAMDITDAVAGQIDLDEVLEIGPLQFVTDKVVQILHEGYKKEVANELAQFEAEGGKVAGRSGGREAVGRSANDTAQEVHRRAKRQVIDVPIPTLQGHVPGRCRFACGLLASHAHQNPFARVGCHVYLSRSQGQGPVLLCVLCIIPSADQDP
ncbi:hypothetical protein C7M84_019637 [Penaeus vannamei]|uniref:Uncharacterized protein n=1 Tax=Penaeus vannamei TaxID=6689 RepID=A0A423SEA5_PENVA|nr:hypothetical protein C7M84_019637 [Penaeus vannamei]